MLLWSIHVLEKKKGFYFPGDIKINWVNESFSIQSKEGLG